MHNLRVKLFGYTDEEKEDIAYVQQRRVDEEKADLSKRRAEIRSIKWQEEIERLENFKDLRIFEAGGVDYIHPPERERPNKY